MTGRNEPCPCGSGRKFKHCCLERDVRTRGESGTGTLSGMQRALAAYHAGNLELASEIYRDVLTRTPGSAAAYTNLGNVELQLGRTGAAVACYEQALRREPRLVAALCGLGNAQKSRRDFDAAAHAYERALAISPTLLAAHVNLSTMLLAAGRLVAAEQSARRALALAPETAELLNNLALILRELGDLDGALTAGRRALALKPDWLDAYSNLLFTLRIHPRTQEAEYLSESRRFGATLTRYTTPKKPAVSQPVRRGALEPLRIGLVSGDLRAHPVGFFLEQVIAAFDRSRISLHAYPTRPIEDATTARLRAHCAGWHPIHNLTDPAAAELIRNDRIDILMDLAGHTAGNRLALFGQRAAPVQASWLGYFATTGVEQMDFLLTDPRSSAGQSQQWFTETLVALPQTRLCFTIPADSAAVAPTPALAAGRVTFGCFQSLAKLNDRVLACWARILAQRPESRLLIRSSSLDEPAAHETLLARIRSAQIDASRVRLAGRLPRAAYLAAYADVDIMLDTFPFTGATTTCEALYMGVPTVTLEGESMIARQGAGLLSNAGLDDWIAADEDDYVARAVRHSGDIQSLAALRATIRERVLGSPLGDAPLFTRGFEQAMERMWQQRGSIS